uniref:Uncharacterized protein n=1 Tax=Athene cunicularia TaxID=194338 RepID=A0A663M2D6_ATHCN
MGEGVLDVVQVLDGIPEGGEHFLAVGTDHGVARDGSGAGEVPEGSEEPLGPGRDLPGQGLGTALGHVDLAPEAVHHGDGWRVACGCRRVRRKSQLLLPRGSHTGECLLI